MTERVLVVEDNPIDEELLRRALRRAQIDVDMVVARDGAEALDWLFATGTRAGSHVWVPRMMVLDLNLPKLSGLEVLRRVRADPQTRLIPVVVLTSSSESRDVIGCYGEGANSYVVKPVDFLKLAESVRQLMWYWLHLNTPAGTPSEDRGAAQMLASAT